MPRLSSPRPQALRLVPPAPAPTGTPSGVFISPDSHLHPSVYAHLGEKVGIKRCIVGRNTAIGRGSKLTNCVLMENVVVGEKCVRLSLSLSLLRARDLETSTS